MKLETIVTCPCGNKEIIEFEFGDEWQREPIAHCEKCDNDFFFEIERIAIGSKPIWIARTYNSRYPLNIKIRKSTTSTIKIYGRR